MNRFVEVAIDNAALAFDKLYTYKVPEALWEFALTGARVLVPFGRADAPRMGVIMGEAVPESESRIKSLIDIERGELALSADLVKTVRFLKERTLCTYADALRTVLPKNSRLVAEDGSIESLSESHLEDAWAPEELSVPPRVTPKQQLVLDAIKDVPLTYNEIKAATGVTRDVLSRLHQKGIVKKVSRQKTIEIYGGIDVDESEIALTAAQKSAYDAITEYADDSEKPDSTLLFGVTSSGKTLIYLKLIKDAVESGKGAVLLLPEITLATQMIYRLRRSFGDKVAILHSALSDSERQLEWDKIRSGQCPVVVGTRSAVFAPLPSIRYIIIDEEQESAYSSEQNPRYNAATIAAFRAKEHGAHLVLSSATPSVETYFLAKQGTINLATLRERYGNMPLPKVRVVDMRKELLAGNSLCIGKYLKDSIDKRLERGEQSILLLNRRGYRTVSVCSSCKTIVRCKSCDTALVYHKRSATHVCHYCGYTEPLRQKCAECGGEIKHTGIGTQKIEEELETLFPKARIARLDLDTTGKKNSASEILRDFGRGEYDILIGTQMIAKGLDFAKVTLVGVLSIDQLLLMPSYEASERTFSMLTQVIGRSGRGGIEGEAIVQSIDPENPVIRLAAEQDYESFYKREMVSRKLHLYPPFCSICTVGFLAPSEKDAAAASMRFSSILKEIKEQRYPDIPLRVLGPAPMRVAYISDTYRYRLVLKCRKGRASRDLIREAGERFMAENKNKKINFFVDFNSAGDM